MKNYEKPMILANEELAEGVYAASGSGISYTVVLSQQGNQWNKVNQYRLSITNTSSEIVTNWSLTLQVVAGAAKGAEAYDSRVSAEVIGNQIAIKSKGNADIQKGGTLEFTVAVTYSGDGVTIQ